MSKPRIGIDLDGVVYNWGDTVRYMIKEYWGIDLPESTHWDYVEENVPKEAWRWLWSTGVDLGLFRYGKLIKGSVEGLRRLSNFGELEVITHRPRPALKDTLRFVENLPDVFSGFHFLADNQPKSSVGCDFYVDDAPHVFNEIVENLDACPVLLDQPWNQGVVTNMRAMNWQEVVMIIGDLTA